MSKTSGYIMIAAFVAFFAFGIVGFLSENPAWGWASLVAMLLWVGIALYRRRCRLRRG